MQHISNITHAISAAFPFDTQLLGGAGDIIIIIIIVALLVHPPIHSAYHKDEPRRWSCIEPHLELHYIMVFTWRDDVDNAVAPINHKS